MYIKKIGINYNGELSPEARNIVAELENPHAPPVQEMDLNQARTSNALLAYDIDAFLAVYLLMISCSKLIKAISTVVFIAQKKVLIFRC